MEASTSRRGAAICADLRVQAAQGGTPIFLSAGGFPALDCSLPFTGSLLGGLDDTGAHVRGRFTVVIIDTEIDGLELLTGSAGSRVLRTSVTAFVDVDERDVLFRRVDLPEVDVFAGADLVILDSVLRIRDGSPSLAAIDCFECRGLVLAHSFVVDDGGVRFRRAISVQGFAATDITLVNSAFDLDGDPADPATLVHVANPVDWTGVIDLEGTRVIVDEIAGAIMVTPVTITDFMQAAGHPNLRFRSNNEVLDEVVLPVLASDPFSLIPGSSLVDEGVDPFGWFDATAIVADKDGACRPANGADIGPDELDERVIDHRT